MGLFLLLGYVWAMLYDWALDMILVVVLVCERASNKVVWSKWNFNDS